jgi:hypothetical protein
VRGAARDGTPEEMLTLIDSCCEYDPGARPLAINAAQKIDEIIASL